MKINVSRIIDHRSVMLAYLPQESVSRETMVMPGAGCTIGSCCTSSGATAR